jgi:hypothetical protein
VDEGNLYKDKIYMFKALRIFFLLLIFAGVALSTWRTRVQSVEWKYTLPVNIYLINGDDNLATADYLRSLTTEDFKPIETFMRDESARYGHVLRAPIEVRLGGEIDSRPPVPPQSGSRFDAVLWSIENALVGLLERRNSRAKSAGENVFTVF